MKWHDKIPIVKLLDICNSIRVRGLRVRNLLLFNRSVFGEMEVEEFV